MPEGPKLRPARTHQPPQPFHVVLVQPEIPQNTGAVARTCAATGSVLHLVGELGFSIDERAVRRAGLDYWHHVTLRTHAHLDHLARELPRPNWHLFSSGAQRSFLDAPVRPGDALLFGKESVGLSPELLAQHPNQTWGIPMIGPVRSLNLSNCVAVVLFEYLRRLGALDDASATHPPLDPGRPRP